MTSISAREALQRLLDGNERYMSGSPHRPNQTAAHRLQAASSQRPFAVIVGCSDSRVPAEIVFDQGIGDLFVIRTAGHRVDELAIASVEFAVQELGSRLVLVLGHESCGAITAAIHMHEDEELEEGADAPCGLHEPANHIPRLLAKLHHVIAKARQQTGDLIVNAAKENVRAVIAKLEESSSVLQHFSATEGMEIHGAYYHLATGRVEMVSEATVAKS